MSSPRQTRTEFNLDNQNNSSSAWRMVSVQEITLVRPGMMAAASKSTLDNTLVLLSISL
jgi:hypothetical protein